MIIKKGIAGGSKRIRKHNKAFNRRCYICGGAVVKDDRTDIWHCLSPDCEAEFREVV